MIQSFGDDFEVSDKKPATPAKAGTLLIKAETNKIVSKKRHKYYRSGVVKLLHMSIWSRPEI